jgi:hypothetical protein
MCGMSTHRPGAGSHVPVTGFGGLVDRIPGGRRYARLGAAALVLLLVIGIGLGLGRGRRVATWEPVEVVDSRDPLQELPLRIAQGEDPVPPAQTYDAVLDLSTIGTLVLGVDLDYVPTGAARYEAVIRGPEGTERFRDRIAESYFAEGRFMLRLFTRRMPAGDYTLEIESFGTDAGEGRIVAASWFQVTH